MLITFNGTGDAVSIVRDEHLYAGSNALNQIFVTWDSEPATLSSVQIKVERSDSQTNGFVSMIYHTTIDGVKVYRYRLSNFDLGVIGALKIVVKWTSLESTITSEEVQGFVNKGEFTYVPTPDDITQETIDTVNAEFAAQDARIEDLETNAVVDEDIGVTVAGIDENGKVPKTNINDDFDEVWIYDTLADLLLNAPSVDKRLYYDKESKLLFKWNGLTQGNRFEPITHIHTNSSTLAAITSAIKAGYDDAVVKKHTHDNKATLDATSESFTTALKEAYDHAATAVYDLETSTVVRVNGQSGYVVLDASDVGAEPAIGEKGTAFNKNFGTGEGDVCQGNDSRLAEVSNILSTVSSIESDIGGLNFVTAEHGDAIASLQNGKADLVDGVLAESQRPTYTAADIGLGNVTNDAQIPLAQKGTANGVAELDNNQKIPLSRIPDSLIGQVKYQNTWNASTNTPTLPSPTIATKGYYYIVNVAGTYNGIDFQTGDWIISNGVTWDKVDNTDAVQSVAGRTGAVTLTKTDVGLNNVDNTSDANKPVSTAQASAIALKANTADLKPHAFTAPSTTLNSGTTTVPSDKLLNDTAALKFDKTSISTVAPVSSAAASDTRVYGEKLSYDQLALKANAASPAFTGQIYQNYKVLGIYEPVPTRTSTNWWKFAEIQCKTDVNDSTQLVLNLSVNGGNDTALNAKILINLASYPGGPTGNIKLFGYTEQASDRYGTLYVTLDFATKKASLYYKQSAAYRYPTISVINNGEQPTVGIQKITFMQVDAGATQPAAPTSGTTAELASANYKQIATTDSPTFTGNVVVPTADADNEAVNKGQMDAADATKVSLTGDQTVAGVKTFSSSPIVPTPTAAGHATNKEYVDLKSYSATTNTYDLVIKNQTDFETMIASSTWLGAVSVALVGQFTLSTANNSGIKIPSTVKQIHGFNNASITITNFAYNATTAKGGLWYETEKMLNGYEVKNVNIDVTSVPGSNSYGIWGLTNVICCKISSTSNKYSYGSASCRFINNTYSYARVSDPASGEFHRASGFASCENIINSYGVGSSTGVGGYGSEGFGFSGCKNVSNCIGRGIASGGYDPEGYGFANITNGSNLKDDFSTTNMWNPTSSNYNINVDTCCKTIVAANNTTLNA